VALTTTVRHGCAVKADATVVCWGDDTSTTVRETRVPAGLLAREVAVGSHHSCALRLDGTVTCWGSLSTQIKMPTGLKVRTIRSANRTVCGLRDDDTLACWGSDIYGMASEANGKKIYVPR
jgi:alpha-tubulin suppressor-like RCC1 family protein